ncbi:glutathione S-transferase family protein [Burkholderiaceae bacterium FT117]|uniref:glutathione S-transferase family protein n=1 Tax=Zeimonas sediminis TaxID=2944268 RepID=UPI002342E652|nr:glutathione S-transferase family protein [Zeimonas sediminis]MCM5569459.1 glutathione S-transferase family protein [Zeimonas sediminis]
MSIVLYDLCGAGGKRFSPNCWRSAMSLAHKGLAWESRATLFTQIPGIGGGNRTVPVIDDQGELIGDSWTIAEHLESRYPDRPSLFGGETGKALARFVQNWTIAQLHAPIFRMIAADIHDALDPADQPYFRESREKRLGKSLEEVQAGREAELPAFRAGLAPLRLTVQAQPFLGGERPSYADYLPFGALQWARTTSPFPLLAADDPVLAWFERCLDLHDGLGRREPGLWQTG